MSINAHNGTVIVFEGADGTGKSTAIQMLNSYLLGEGYSVLCLNVISCSPEGQLFRKEFTTKELDPVLQTVGFLNSSAIAFERFVFPSKSDYDFILVDRGWASILAYQVVANGQSYALDVIMHILKGPNYKSIVNIHLTTQPQIAIERLKENGRALDTIESKGSSYQARCVKGYEWAFSFFPVLKPKYVFDTGLLNKDMLNTRLQEVIQEVLTPVNT